MNNWCGWIDKIYGDKFTATMYDIELGAESKFNFTLDDVAQKDRKLVKKGAFIEWNPFEDKVIFQKVPLFSRKELDGKSKIVDEFNKWIIKESE